MNTREKDIIESIELMLDGLSKKNENFETIVIYISDGLHNLRKGRIEDARKEIDNAQKYYISTSKQIKYIKEEEK